nr:2444_t:CDS:2 [Entrophospora candida]
MLNAPNSNNEKEGRHIHTLSAVDFQSASSGVAAKTMRSELQKMALSIQDMKARRAFQNEMDNFYLLFTRYLSEKSKGTKLDWDKVKQPSPEQIIPYKNLSPVCENTESLNKLAVLKLNGGLGTTMGCIGPKSAIEVRDNMTFLDLSVRQIEYFNSNYNVNVPFILMNSFNTDDETKRIIQKYSSHKIDILTFNQSRYPRINKESLLPMPRSINGDISQWYPPGHGDLFESMANSGILDQLIADGKEYLFVSNVDNLGAVVDLKILQHFVESGAEFLMEVTDKTKADIKGGTLIDYEGNIRLLEVAQVPAEYMEEFKSIKKFKIFNTNNLWINLKAAAKRISDEKKLDLDVIYNSKTLESGEKVIQLETAVGAAIKHFKNAHGINVPRSRFLPVKSTSDLFLVTSDLYSLHHGELVMNPKRLFQTVPLVKLVTGDVTFGSGVQLKGTVIIVANHGARIDIPSQAVLENKVVSGNLRY